MEKAKIDGTCSTKDGEVDAHRILPRKNKTPYITSVTWRQVDKHLFKKKFANTEYLTCKCFCMQVICD